MAKTGTIVRCVCCNGLGRLRARGLIDSCWARAYRKKLLDRAGLASRGRGKKKPKCAVPGCRRVGGARSLCRRHYDAWVSAKVTRNPWRSKTRDFGGISEAELALARARFDDLLYKSLIKGHLSKKEVEKAEKKKVALPKDCLVVRALKAAHKKGVRLNGGRP